MNQTPWPLRAYRQNLPRPMTMKQVAELVRTQFGLKCTESHIANCERGRGCMSVRVLAALAMIYGRPRGEIHRAYHRGVAIADRQSRRKRRTA